MAGFSGSLDANVLLRLLLNDLPAEHHVVVQLFQSATGQFAVADIAIMEVVFVLERNYKFNRSATAEAIEGLMSLTKINCNRPLFARALALFLAHMNLSFEECCLAVYTELNGAAPLWTCDQKLAKQVSTAKLISTSMK